jgi:hypothetical protein
LLFRIKSIPIQLPKDILQKHSLKKIEKYKATLQLRSFSNARAASSVVKDKHSVCSDKKHCYSMGNTVIPEELLDRNTLQQYPISIQQQTGNSTLSSQARRAMEFFA